MACAGHPEVDWAGNRRLIKGRHGAVASDHSRCSEMGVAILKSNGNAADATVTVALCEGLYNPMASGIGGGGFINVLSPNGSAEIVDAREFAPSGASERMFKGAMWDCSCRISYKHTARLLPNLVLNSIPQQSAEQYSGTSGPPKSAAG